MRTKKRFQQYEQFGSLVRLIRVLGMMSVLICLFSVVFLHQPVSAQDDDACVGVDLVILVDESGSMLTNDPTNLRMEAVRNIITNLGDNTLYFCPEVAHRISVVGFWDERNGGVDTEAYLSDEVIFPSLEEDGLSVWQNTREQLKGQLQHRTDSPGATDYKSAFETARTILDKWVDEDLPGGDTYPRRQGVVLVADGGPCVYDLGCNTPGQSMNMRTYMQDLVTYLDPNGANFPWRGEDNPNSVYIWFVGFRDSTASSEYDYLNSNTPIGRIVLPSWQRIVQDHGGSLEILNSGEENATKRNANIQSKVEDILEDVTNNPSFTINCDEEFYVNPYGDRLIVLIKKVGADPGSEPEEVDVTLQYVSPFEPSSLLRGSVIQGESLEVGDYSADGPSERYVLVSPPPGAWRILVSGGECQRDVDARYIPVSGEGKVIAPEQGDVVPQYDIPPYVDPITPVYLRYFLSSRPSGQDEEKPIGHIPLPLIDEYPLTMEGIVTGADGQNQLLHLERQIDGSWQSLEAIQVPVSGVSEWEVVATAPNGEKTETVEILRDEGAFEVSKVDHFSFEIIAPLVGADFPTNTVGNGEISAVPVDVAVRVLDGTGNIMEKRILEEVTGAAPLFTATLRSAFGGIEQSVPMAFNSARNTFEASLREEQDLVQGAIDPAGDYSISAELNPEGYNQFKFRPDLTSVQVDIERFKVTPVLVEVSPTSITRSSYVGELGCIGAKPVQFDIDLKLTNAQTGEVLSVEDITTSPEQFLTARMLETGTEKEIQVTSPERYSTDSGPVMRLVFGGEEIQPGEYVVRVQFDQDAMLSGNNLLSGDDILVPITLTLAILDNPGTCRATGGGAIILLVLLLMFMLFNWVKRPVGMLSIVDSSTEMTLRDYSLGRHISLLFKRKRTLSGSGLEEFNIGKIVVSKTEPEQAHRAIEMEVFDNDGTSLGSTNIDSDSEAIVTYDISARYD